MGSWIIESVAYCNKILIGQLYKNSAQKSSVNWTKLNGSMATPIQKKKNWITIRHTKTNKKSGSIYFEIQFLLLKTLVSDHYLLEEQSMAKTSSLTNPSLRLKNLHRASSKMRRNLKRNPLDLVILRLSIIKVISSQFHQYFKSSFLRQFPWAPKELKI